MAYYRKDQLSIKTRKLLADQFADIILIVQSIQSFRMALATTQFFNGIQLFRFLDKDQKGYLTPKDFIVLVGEQSKKILHYAFGWFDVSKVGEITRTQFLQFLFPHRNPELRQRITERMIQQCDLQIKNATIPAQLDLLRSLIQQIMEKQIKLIAVRRNLMQQQDYTIKAVMNCLDVQSRGWITTGDLYKFLKNFDVDVEPISVCEMLGVYDNDLNGKIQMEQLQLLVEGLQRSDNSYRQIVRNSDKKAKQKLRRSRCTCYKNVMHQSAQKINNPKRNNQQYKIYTAQKNTNQEQQHENKQIKSIKNKKKNKLKQDIQNQGLKNKKEQKIKKSKNQKEPQQFSPYKNQKKIKQNLKNLSQIESYDDLKHTFLILQKQTQEIDQDLLKIEEELQIKTQMELRKQLQNAKIKRSLKQHQRQIVRRKMEQMQLVRQAEELRRIQTLQTARRLQIQKRKHLQIQLQRSRKLQQQNQRIHQIQLIRARQIQLQNIRIRNMQQIKTRQIQKRRLLENQIQKRRLAETQNLKYLQLQRAKQAQISATLYRNSLQRQSYIRQMNMNQQRNHLRIVQSQLDWKAEARLKTIHELQSDHSITGTALKQKQNEYFQRYSNYCNHLALVVDPLGIKQHIAETDKYLIRSRQLRDQIKRDRTYSLNRYTNVKSSEKKTSKQNTQNDEFIEKTPQQNRDIINTINKRTQQTKLVWS